MLLEHFFYFLGCGDIDDADTVIIHVDLLMSALILAVRSVDYDFGNELVDNFGSKLLYLGYLLNLGNKLFNIVRLLLARFDLYAKCFGKLFLFRLLVLVLPFCERSTIYLCKTLVSSSSIS